MPGFDRLLVASSKGGVGKSTAALGLAAEFARLGKRVLLCDLDFTSRSLDLLTGCEDSALFGRLNTLLDRLIEEQSAAENDTDYNPDLWSDIPSTWWQNPSGQNNGITSSDLQGFRSLPGQVSSAVSRGISGIKVTLDGQTVGNLVAPYVSNYIAASMFE